MAALDRVKEEVAYGLAVAGVLLLTLVSLILHRQIHSRIALMERL